MEVRMLRTLLRIYEGFSSEEKKDFIRQDLELLKQFRKKRLANGCTR